jgi:transposase-like protein
VIKDHLNKVVVTAVEGILNALLDAEADQLCGAKRYECSPDRIDTRAVGAFPGGNNARILVSARLRHIMSTQWGPQTLY